MITVYVIRGLETGKRYVGISNDVSRRLAEHRRGNAKGSRMIGAFELLHVEQYPDYPDARKRERYLKSGKGREWLDQKFGGSWPACGHK